MNFQQDGRSALKPTWENDENSYKPTILYNVRNYVPSWSIRIN